MGDIWVFWTPSKQGSSLDLPFSSFKDYEHDFTLGRQSGLLAATQASTSFYLAFFKVCFAGIYTPRSQVTEGRPVLAMLFLFSCLHSSVSDCSSCFGDQTEQNPQQAEN